MEVTEVLICETSYVNTKIITNALLSNSIQNYKFEKEKIYTAKNGLEAFNLIGNKKNITLLISEINTPHLNADDLIEVLQDTNLASKIKVIFLSEDKNYNVKSSIKENSLGIIYKPFTSKNIFNKLDNLLNPKPKESQIEYKKENRLQKEVVKFAISKLFKDQNIKTNLDEDILNDILDIYFDDNFQVTNEELEYIFYTAIQEIFEVLEIKLDLAQNILKKTINEAIYKNQKKDIRKILLNEALEASLQNTKRLITSKSKPTSSMVLESFISPINNKIKYLSTKIASFETKKTSLNSSEIIKMIDFLKKIDITIDDIEITKLKTHLLEIETFVQNLRQMNLNHIISLIPQLSKSRKFLQNVVKQYQIQINALNKIATFYKNELVSRLLYKSLNSKDIVAFFKQNIKNQLPTISNIMSLYSDKKEVNDDRSNIVYIGSDLDTLQSTKKALEKEFCEWKVFCFTRVSILEGWIKANRIDKLIVDFRFSDSVLNDGIKFIKYFNKKFKTDKNCRSLFINHRIYLVIDPSKISSQRNLINNFNIHIIEAPATLKNIKNILMYS